jgi:hypothetical protein
VQRREKTETSKEMEFPDNAARKKNRFFSKNIGKNTPNHGINKWQTVKRTACHSNKNPKR